MGGRTWAIAMLVCLAAWVSPRAHALDPDRSLRQLHHTAWRRAEGAPSQISAIAQARDGRLWLGSTQGLFRFDGIRFERFEPRNGAQLPSYNTYALHPMDDGGLWVAFRPSGLGLVRDDKLTLYTRSDQMPSTQVYGFATARDGRLFAGTHAGMAQWTGSRWVDLAPSWGLPRDRVRRMLALPRGLAVMVGDTVWWLPANARRFRKLADIPGDPIEMIAAADDTLWISSSTGMLRIPPGGEPMFASSDGDSPTLEMIFDRDGALWLGGAGGLKRIRAPRTLASFDAASLARAADSFTAADGLTSDMVIHLLEDREGNLWVATAHGLDRFRWNPIVPFAMPGTMASNTIAPGEGGSVWAAPIVGESLVRIDAADRDRDEPARPAGTHPMQVRSVARARDGTLWWGGFHRLYRQRGEDVEVIPGPPGLVPDWFWDVIASPDGKGWWVGAGDDGVWDWRDGRWSRARLPPGMLARVPSASWDDGAGTRWFGYTDNRVRVLRDGRVTAYGPADGLDIGRAKVIRGNAVQRWVGGELGVAWFNGQRFHRVRFADSPQPGAVGGIVPTRSGDVWLSEMRGLIRIPSDEVRALLRDPRHVVRAERFDEADGVPGAPQMNTTSSTALEASDGVLWFVTDSGLAWVDPTKLRAPLPNPSVRLLGVRSEGAVQHPRTPVRFPVGSEQLEFSFGAVTLTAPERVRFRYRLDGFDDRWQDAGTRREAHYSRVPPGDYTFRVMAAQPGRPFSGPAESVQVSIAPAFWQTRWFLAACLLAGALLLGCLYWLRLRQVERRMLERLQERHGERERIARELHDTLLQGIHGLILRFHAIAVRIPAESPVRTAMDSALDRADDMLVEGRDRVSNLRTSMEPVTSLPIALTRAGQQLAEGFPGQFVHAVQGVERTIDPIVQDDIYQLGREALFNAFNHSAGSRIELLMVFDHHRFALRVLDNGRGLDPKLATGGMVPGHWGLAGMRERAERVSGSLSIGRGADGGTAVELVVPARVAYAVSAATRFRDWALRRATIAGK